MLCNAHVHTYVVTIRIRSTRELGGNVWKMSLNLKTLNCSHATTTVDPR